MLRLYRNGWLSVLVALAAACKDPPRVQLPVPSGSDQGLTLTLNHQVVGSGSLAPADETVTSDHIVSVKQGMTLLLIGNAKDPTGGVKSFSISIVQGGSELMKVTNTSSPDASNMVPSVLALMGTNGSGGPGPNGIQFTASCTPTQAIVSGTSYGGLTSTITVSYIVLGCPPPVSGPGGMGGTGMTGGGTTARMTGDFVEVTSAATTPGTTASSATGSFNASVSLAGSSSPQKYVAILKNSSNQTCAIPFSIGGHYGLGGVGFSKNSGIAVVATWNNSLSSGIAEDISFIVAPLPGAFSSCNTPTESYGAYEVVSGGSTASYVQPRFYASPDATLGIVVSANKGGLSTIPSLLNVFDRLTGKKLNTTPITYKVSMKAAVTAGSPQTVSITLDGATTPVTLNIP